MSASFPYFAIARTYGVDYGKVLAFAEFLAEIGGDEGARIQVMWDDDCEERWGFTHDVASAVRDAVVSEHRRRLGGE